MLAPPGSNRAAHFGLVDGGLGRRDGGWRAGPAGPGPETGLTARDGQVTAGLAARPGCGMFGSTVWLLAFGAARLFGYWLFGYWLFGYWQTGWY